MQQHHRDPSQNFTTDIYFRKDAMPYRSMSGHGFVFPMQALFQQAVFTQSHILRFDLSNNWQGKSRSMYAENCTVCYVSLIPAPTCAASRAMIV